MGETRVQGESRAGSKVPKRGLNWAR